MISQHPPLAYYVLLPVFLWGRKLTIYYSKTTLLTEVNICKNISWFYFLPFTHCLFCALCLTVLWVMHRHSMGGLNGPANILLSEVVVRLAWSHAASVCTEMPACHYGGVTLLCMRPLPDLNCGKETGADLQWPATGHWCKVRNCGELGRQRGQRVPPAGWGQS